MARKRLQEHLTPNMSHHPAGLTEWIAEALQCAPSHIAIELIAGDASPRRYYRVTPSSGTVALAVGGKRLSVPSCVAMVSPASENNEAFLSIGAELAEAGVRTPTVWARSLQRGWFLLEDFGDEQLLPVLTSDPDSVDLLYQRALDALISQISLPLDQASVPAYDAGRLEVELAVFPEWFFSGLLGIQSDQPFRQCFGALSNYLISVFADQPVVWVHRDFHSRNLMLLEVEQLGVIDFQDAVLGPITYDPVSLLKDCYIRWPRERQLGWLDDYLIQLKALSKIASSTEVPMLSEQQLSPLRILATQLEDVSEGQFQRWFDLTGLQRHLKVLGVFARLHLRDHKSSYLSDLPMVTAYVREALALTEDAHHSVAEFRDWFESDLMPVIREQPWHKSIEAEGWAL